MHALSVETSALCLSTSMGSLATDQALALAMARHNRLGAASPAASLNADTTQLIHSFVRDAHEELVSAKRIVAIYMKTGDLVDRVEMHYSDGTHSAHGGMGGRWREPLLLKPDEYITRVSGKKGDSLDSICFTTNKQDSHVFAGRLNGGRRFGWKMPPNHELVDISGRQHQHHNRWLRSVEGFDSNVSPW